MKRALMFAQIGAFVVSGLLATTSFADPPAASASGDPVEQTLETSGSDTQFEEFDSERFEAEYSRANIERYDALRSSPSPRQQVIAGQIYLEHEEDTPALVRPRRADVVARAVQLAPDDSFVQWMAASQGSYTSSQCGPSTRPQAEVANLIRLEPDNAAAWRFAVALASAIGDQDGIDDALSRMAAAPRADDHSIEQLEEWKKAYTAVPEPSTPWQQPELALSNDDRVMLAAMQRIGSTYSSAATVMLDLCKMEVDSERIWQRLGWCADAATTLASRGGSLALREQGLGILAAIGAKDATFDSMQRQYDWLVAHNANPARSYNADSAEFAAAISDWKGVTTEIEAIERHLQRIGQPLAPPPGWNPKTVPERDAATDSTQQAWMAYTRSLVDGLRASSDARQQALAISVSAIVSMASGSSESGPGNAVTATTEQSAAMQRLAAANPDNLLVQWIAATSTDLESDRSAVSTAIGQVQRLDADNGASWALSLAVDPEAADLALPQVAAGTRFDDHAGEILAIWMDAARKQPPSDDQAKAMATDMPSIATASYGLGAAMMSKASMKIDPVFAVAGVCQSKMDADSARRQTCATVARLLLNAGTSMLSVSAGERILRKLDALDERDTVRARTVAWWMNVAMPENSFDAEAMARFMDDVADSGSEIEALRLAAQRAGKSEPPQAWRSPAEKKKSPAKAVTVTPANEH
ncbi:MAG: hypothetical protein IPP82_14100 [Xanthomonadales bacterium]|nr:hypothetical protein [Xanthomonadales bacterium]